MKKRFLKTATLSLLFMAMSAVAVSTSNAWDDWPNFRGPNHNDISTETGLLKSWPENGPKQVWKFDQAGLGYAGFAVVGDHLYTLGMEQDQGEFGLCLNAETGKEVWRTKIATIDADRGRATAGWGDGSRSSPTVDEDRVYFMSCSGSLACLKRDSGEEVWSAKMSDFGGSPPAWGYSESPLVDGDKVICTPGGDQGAVLALNKMTGRKIWQSGDAKADAHYSSLVPAKINDQKQYVQLLVNGVVGLAPDTGKVLWKSDWEGRVAVIPSPVVKDNRVYVTSGYKTGSKAIDVDPQNNAKQAWFDIGMQNHHGGVILVGDHLYGFTDRERGAFACQSLKTGEILWRDKAVSKGSVTYADGMFYHLEEQSGKVSLIKAGPDGMQVVSSFKLSPQSERRHNRGRIWAHPVVSDGKLYLRDQDIVCCYELRAAQ